MSDAMTGSGQRLMALGLFVFELKTIPFEGTSRQTEYRWGGKDRAGGPPAHQYLGQGNDTLTIDGVLMPELTGGRKQLDQLRKMAAEGKAWILLSGDGVEQGQYFIERVEEKGSHHLSNGAPRKIEFSVGLKRYWGDDAKSTLGNLPASLPDGGLRQAVATAAASPASVIGAVKQGIKEAAGNLSAALGDAAGISGGDVAATLTKVSAAARTLPGLIPGKAGRDIAKFATTADRLARGDITLLRETLSRIPAGRDALTAAERLETLSTVVDSVSRGVAAAGGMRDLAADVTAKLTNGTTGNGNGT